MEHAHQVGLLDKVHKSLPLGAFAFGIAVSLSTLYSQFSVNNKKTDENTSQIEHLQQEEALHQRQLDQGVALQEQLKALSEQNKQTQQEVHELAVDLHEFESRFIVVPHR